ncbi:MAG: hypothetical protein K9J38_10270 [Polynucleobacter sp.]|nr:hypothetical protein [Polynucleobacter sp.]
MINKILIIEPNVDGHYGVYLREIVNFLLQKDVHIFLALDNGFEASLFLKNLIDRDIRSNRISIVQLPLLYRPKKYSFLNNLWSQVRYWYACRKAYKKASIANKIELVFLPYLDRLIYAFSILGSPFKNTPSSGIVMRPTFHHYEMDIKSSNMAGYSNLFLKPFLFRRALKLKSLKSIFTIDLSFLRFSQDRLPTEWTKIQYFPDPADQTHLSNKELARHHFCIDLDKVVILLYGSIDMRKGVIGALEWTLQARSNGIKAQLLILGRQSEEVRQYFKNSLTAKNLFDDNALFVVDRYIESDEENLAFSAADLVWLKYRHFDQMSGVMVKAGMLDLPMALPDHGVMGWYKEQFLKSSDYADFSLPRLKINPKLNPFSEHTWKNSLLKLNSLIE